MRVLVTGGAGYIGSHVCKEISAAGFEPIVFDNLSTGHSWAVKWGPLVTGDLRDREHIRQAIRLHGIEAVIHLAASAYVGESMADPGKYFDNNVVTSLNLLGVMREEGVRHIVFSSSCTTYGEPLRVPLDEDHTQNPISPYGESKLFVEKALRWYGSAYGLNSVALRFFNASGADVGGQIGEEHLPETHLIPLVIKVAQGILPDIAVFGEDYPTPDGTAIRDYVHVSDLAHAHVLALKYLLDGGQSTALNLGLGKGYSVRDVIRAVEKVSGRPVPFRCVERRPGDPPALVARADRAYEVLTWRPQFTSLEEIVETAWQWHLRRV